MNWLGSSKEVEKCAVLQNIHALYLRQELSPSVDLTYNLQILQRLKMHGAVPPFQHTSSWRGN